MPPDVSSPGKHCQMRILLSHSRLQDPFPYHVLQSFPYILNISGGMVYDFTGSPPIIPILSCPASSKASTAHFPAAISSVATLERFSNGRLFARFVTSTLGTSTFANPCLKNSGLPPKTEVLTAFAPCRAVMPVPPHFRPRQCGNNQCIVGSSDHLLNLLLGDCNAVGLPARHVPFSHIR